MHKNTQGIIYHYCSLEAFQSIIENKCLWLCDVEKSNDSAERIYYENIMLKQIDAQIKQFQSIDDTKNANLDITILHKFRRLIEAPDAHRAITYSCSFSLNGDLLSQWRGYADDGYGVSLGFASDYLEKQRPHGSDFRPISYDLSQAEQSCSDILQETLQCSTQSEFMDSFYPDISFPLLCALQRLEMNHVFYKSTAFEEEQEYRIAMKVDNSNFQIGSTSLSICAPRVDPNESSNLFSCSAPKFRIANRKLSSYVELDFSRCADLFLSAINLGPKCLAEPNDIKHFLASCGYRASCIQINQSSATYR